MLFVGVAVETRAKKLKPSHAVGPRVENGDCRKCIDARSEKLPLGTHHCSIPCDHCDLLKHLLPVSTVSFTQRGRI